MKGKEENTGCSLNVAELAFIVVVIANAFFDADVEWWVVLAPLIVSYIYYIVELVIKIHNKAKK